MSWLTPLDQRDQALSPEVAPSAEKWPMLKDRLLKAAAAGWSKPLSATALGGLCEAWMDARNADFDPDFTAQIISVRPDWHAGAAGNQHVGALHWSKILVAPEDTETQAPAP